MKVQQVSGGWAVVDGDRIVERFHTNAEAWRWLDRRQGEFVSPREKAHDYGWRKFASDE